MAKKHLKPLETRFGYEEEDIIYLSPSPVTGATSKKKDEEFSGSSGKVQPSEMNRGGASVYQYIGKVRQWKRKYMKKRKNGFSEAHDQKCFELANSIWGTKEILSKKMDSKGKKVEKDYIDVTNSDWLENSFLLPSIESLGVDSVKHKLSVVPVETKKKIEETLTIKKRQCLKQKTELLKEVIDVMT